MFKEGTQIQNFTSIRFRNRNYGSGSSSDFLTSYGSCSGSASQKVTVPVHNTGFRLPVPVQKQ